MAQDTYMGGVIAMVTLEVAFIAFLIFIRDRYYPLNHELSTRGRTYFDLMGSHLNKKYNFWLATTRIWSFLYFLTIAWAWDWAVHDDGGADGVYFYFTHWNIVLLTVYFFVSSICSISYIFVQRNPEHVLAKNPQYALYLERFAQNAARTHDVAGTCAFFVTVII